MSSRTPARNARFRLDARSATEAGAVGPLSEDGLRAAWGAQRCPGQPKPASNQQPTNNC